MRPRTLLILLAVVLILGAFIWFYERKLPSSEERVELGKRVFSLEKDDVTAVTIDSEKGEVRLERMAAAKGEKKEKPRFDEKGLPPEATGEWKMVRPLAVRADAFAIDRLLESLSTLEKSRTLDEVDPKAVGLDKPRATVRLATKDGERVLKLGADVPPGGSIIAGVAGVDGRKGAYVVADTILSEVIRNPGDWRDRQMLHGDREAIQRITLTGGPGGPLVLVQRPQGLWMEKPFTDRADHDLSEGLLADLTGLMAERFVDPPRPAAELGLVPPREIVEVAFKGQPPVRIELGAPVTGGEVPEGQTAGELTYARIGDAVFEARTRLAESARRDPAAWRAVQLSSFEVFQVESATVQDDKTALKLTRAGTDWKRGDTVISYLPVSDLLFAVTGAKASRLLSPQEAQALHAGQGKPLLTFILHGKDQGDETLTLYPELKEGVPVRASGRETVLLISADTLKQIQGKLQDVRTAKPVGPEKK
jgi:uncharacterized protein DUF4340